MTPVPEDQETQNRSKSPPTADELKAACATEVYDHVGNKIILGDLIQGKRSVLIFTRHFCKPHKAFSWTHGTS